MPCMKMEFHSCIKNEMIEFENKLAELELSEGYQALKPNAPYIFSYMDPSFDFLIECVQFGTPVEARRPERGH